MAVLAALLVTPGPAGASSPDDPRGFVDSAVDAGQSQITVTGWAADPNAVGQTVTVLVLLDGAPGVYTTTTLPRPDVAAATKLGPTTGFTASLLVTPGQHRICASARNIGAGASAALGNCKTVTVAGLPAEVAAAHSPSGYLDSVSVQQSAISVGGWAVDPDLPTQPLQVYALLDGTVAKLTSSSPVARPDVQAARRAGPNQGFALSLTAADGPHTLCVDAVNLGAGAPSVIGCRQVQVGQPPLTPAQIAAHSPTGALEAASAVNANSLQVRGWASDPDNKGYGLVVAPYVDGIPHTPMRATLSRPDLAGNLKAGSNPGYSFPMSVPAGAHNVCVWAVNIGIGANQLLGCLSLTTPATAMPGGPAPATPPANTKVVAAAKKLLGSKYVWGGEDPKVGFDCSGLVQYTYQGAGLSTPRVAQDQFSKARMISASRAVPGDLVFYHDSEGAVYHVGVYVSPGVSYAAVDPANGVRVQNIWDSTATYGSFTHS